LATVYTWDEWERHEGCEGRDRSERRAEGRKPLPADHHQGCDHDTLQQVLTRRRQFDVIATLNLVALPLDALRRSAASALSRHGRQHQLRDQPRRVAETTRSTTPETPPASTKVSRLR
jgi:hypothetical protein